MTVHAIDDYPKCCASPEIQILFLNPNLYPQQSKSFQFLDNCLSTGQQNCGAGPGKLGTLMKYQYIGHSTEKYQDQDHLIFDRNNDKEKKY